MVQERERERTGWVRSAIKQTTFDQHSKPTIDVFPFSLGQSILQYFLSLNHASFLQLPKASRSTLALIIRSQRERIPLATLCGQSCKEQDPCQPSRMFVSPETSRMNIHFYSARIFLCPLGMIEQIGQPL